MARCDYSDDDDYYSQGLSAWADRLACSIRRKRKFLCWSCSRIPNLQRKDAPLAQYSGECRRVF